VLFIDSLFIIYYFQGGIFEVVNGRIYLPIEHVQIRGIIASIDVETLEWTIFDFATQVPIKQLVLFYDTDLVIHGYKLYRTAEGMIKMRYEFYKIAVQ
jgi:hypothetical protein